MRPIARIGILGCIAAGMCNAQRAAFEAASIKVVKLSTHPAFGNRGGPGTSDPGRIHLCCVGMYSLLMRAYDVELDQIAAPSWVMDNMGGNLYEVDATMPPGTTKAQFQAMMRALLAERFHVEVHRETRLFPGYELVVVKGGPKFKASTLGPNAAAESALPPGPQMLTSLGRGMVRVQVQQKAIADLVKEMGRLITDSMGGDPGDFSTPKPRVVDKTGLTGIYDFKLEFSCEGCAGLSANLPVGARSPEAADPAALPNIFGALEKQLGLKLVKIKEIPLEIIVVDHADKIPTAN